MDKANFPRAKVCGCCLNISAVQALEELGVLEDILALGPISLRSLKLFVRGFSAEIKLPRNVALSRQAFDATLVRLARDAGAKFLPNAPAKISSCVDGTRLVQIDIDGRVVSQRARVAIVADGIAGSALASAEGFHFEIKKASRIGAGTVLANAPAFYSAQQVFMATGVHGYVGLVQLEDGSLDIAAALDPDFTQLQGGPAQAVERIMEEVGLPKIANLNEAIWRGTPALTRRRAKLAGERIFVIGDAASYSEPFTGEGMSWAIRSGKAIEELAVAAVSNWNKSLEDKWSAKHQNLIGKKQATSSAISALLRKPFATTSTVRLLAALPTVGAAIAKQLGETR